ncbi:MAG: carbohydrate binding family 9 domain-containing protein [Deltaproteobacteria bacterium]|nr:carbohydrate binding family 9 domain-containing protein [Deltaproteobacteria bacterium]
MDVRILAVLLSGAAPLPAAPTPSLVASRLQGPLTVDGRLDESAWRDAAVASGFRQWTPNRDEPARLETRVRVLFDDAYLYVGASLENPGGPARIAARVHRRDRDSTSDWFGVSIDVEGRGRNARMFRVNAANAQRDLLQLEEADDDDTWDAVWDSATSIEPAGWSVEMRIPLEVLRPEASPAPQRWGIYFYRENQSPYEVTGWMVVPRGAQGFVSHFYPLEEIVVSSPPRRRDLTAHASERSKVRTIAPYDDLGGTLRAGVDASLGVGATGQLDVSLLPDFGHVEVDRQVLNLSTTETFFPEKRPFFTEGADAFTLPGLRLFYSRRIGHALAPPVVPDGTAVVERPLNVDLLAAARYTRHSADGWRVAALGAVTRDAEAKLRDPNGRIETATLEEAQGYGLARVSRALGDRGGYVGAFVGWTDQRGASGRRAQVAAVDSSWRSPTRRTRLTGIIAGSISGAGGDEERGWGADLELIHTFRVPWTATLHLTELSSGFDPNDLGYLARPDVRQGWIDVRRQWDRTAGVFRNWEVAFGGMVREDHAGHTLTREVEATLGTQFTNLWRVSAIVGAYLAADDDQELRTFGQERKLNLRRPDRPFAVLSFGTAPQATWSVSGEAGWTSWEGGPTNELSISQVIRPTPRLEVELDTSYQQASGERRWLETPTPGAPVVGLRALRQLDQSIRVSFAVSTRATMQLFSQWRAARWSFRESRTWSGGGGAAAVATGPTAFSDRTWNLNLIGQWQFRRGSTAYLVYTRGAEAPVEALESGRSGLGLSDDLASLHRVPSQDVVQAKVTWRF